MVQMGALFNQPLHCRKKPLQQDRASPRDILPNTIAVHSAAIAGYEDIVLLLLQANNMMDLNMPTFHSKDTLMHLAVKNSLRDLFNNLAWLGADLCIKSGDGRRVCDVTHDVEWAREIATYIPQSSGQTGQHSRKRNSGLQSQRVPPARLRDSLLSRCSEMNTPSNAGVRTGKKTNNKKGKKGTQKKPRRTPQKEESIIAAAAEPKDTRFEEKLRLLVSLLVSAGLNFEAKTDSASVTTLEELLMTTVAALFSRLRDPSTPASDKTDDVKHACKLVEELMEYVQRFSHPSRINSTRLNHRSLIASIAANGIYMMQRFYRVDHAALAGPNLLPFESFALRQYLIRSLWSEQSNFSFRSTRSHMHVRFWKYWKRVC
ncbi:hypothetical protein JG688_00011835 [Phytophthora aleatoria]|uniref:Uncharacterized protein n=1 Tax=Phytophthora aleatoria TaxID=2496075 RepID=A0A8J5M0M9_9STRA|nr:hypothetical protein JG688_00011835 [Phytophthora aleatoria]